MSNEMDVKNGDLVHRCTGLLVYGRYHLFDQKLECGICDSPRERDGRWRRCRCGKPLPWATKRRRRVAEECRSFGLSPYERNTAIVRKEQQGIEFAAPEFLCEIDGLVDCQAAVCCAGDD